MCDAPLVATHFQQELSMKSGYRRARRGWTGRTGRSRVCRSAEDSELPGSADGVGAVVDVELLVHALGALLGGRPGDSELVGDHRERRLRGQQTQDLCL